MDLQLGGLASRDEHAISCARRCSIQSILRQSTEFSTEAVLRVWKKTKCIRTSSCATACLRAWILASARTNINDCCDARGELREQGSVLLGELPPR